MQSLKSVFYLLVISIVIAMVLPSVQAEDDESSKVNPVRRASPWSMNSIGYNAGLEGLRKYFGKRSGEVSEPDSELLKDIDSDSTIDIIEEFAQYLQMKENGSFGPELLRCVLSQAGNRGGSR